MTRRDLWRRTVRLAVVASIVAPGSAMAAPSPAGTVIGAVQVTANPSPVRAHSSPQIARNPKTGELAIGEVDVRGGRRCQVHLSMNDGRTWTPGGDLMVEPYTDCSIGAEWGTTLTLFFDVHGTLFVAFAANDPLVFGSDRPVSTRNLRAFVPRPIFLARSTDGGRTFSTTMAYNAPANNPDLGYSFGIVGAVHPRDASRVYVTWAQGDWTRTDQKTKSVVAASSDGGKTFAAPVDITDERGSEHAWIAVGPDGVVHATFWPQLGFRPGDPVLPMQYARSTDHGASWERQEIDEGMQSYFRPPTISADPHSPSVYVVWYGHANAMNRDPGFVGDLDIFLRRSTDGGKTWGDRVVLNDDRAGANQFQPGIAVAPSGRVDVAWYDGRLSPVPPDTSGRARDTGLQDVYVSSSEDGGQTWSPNLRVTDRSIDRSLGVFLNGIGSSAPVGVAATTERTYFAWQDTRAGNETTHAEDVYMSTLIREIAGAGRTTSWLLLPGGFALGLGVAGVVCFGYLRLRDRPAA